MIEKFYGKTYDKIISNFIDGVKQTLPLRQWSEGRMNIPRDESAEKCILGAILLDQRLIAVASERLEASSFYLPFHQKVFKAMLSLHYKGDDIDPILIGGLIGARNGNQAKSVTQITALSHGIPHYDNIDRYIDVVIKKAKRRNLANTASDIVNAVIGSDDSDDEVIEKATRSILSLASNNGLAASSKIFVQKCGNEWLETPTEPMRSVCGDLIQQGELVYFFVPTGSGKSLQAMQLADAAARGEAVHGLRCDTGPLKTLYFDFELGDPMLHKRYTDPSTHEKYRFSEDFARIRTELKEYAKHDNPDIMAAMTEVIGSQQLDKKLFVVIDNITAIVESGIMETAKDAAPVIRALRRLRDAFDLTMLVIAHTPKRDDGRPITLNDMTGSSNLSNFADAVFAIGRSSKDPKLRYLKTCKARNVEETYHAKNVIVMEKRRIGPLLGFEFIEFGDESDHLVSTPRRTSATDQAEAFLMQVLADGPRRQMEIFERAKGLDIKEATLQRVKRSLRIESQKERFSGQWSWKLPDTEGEDGLSLGK